MTTTSTSFSSNRGSLLTFSVSTRQGLRLWSAQILLPTRHVIGRLKQPASLNHHPMPQSVYANDAGATCRAWACSATRAFGSAGTPCYAQSSLTVLGAIPRELPRASRGGVTESRSLAVSIASGDAPKGSTMASGDET